MTKELSKLELEEIQAKEIEMIMNSKAFRRLKDKTQVLMPSHEYSESVMNRQSHSIAVASSANAMAISIAKSLGLSSKNDIDYTYSLTQSCLLHDIGHPPFGHDGAKLISDEAKARGLDEGFDDNNNNLKIIETSKMKLRDSVLASIIKYPHKLYNSQKKYLKILKDELKKDKEHYAKMGINLKNQKKTMNCQIMDEADRNTYTCDDMRDYFSLNDGKEEYKFYTIHDILKLKSIDNSPEQLELINELLEVVNPKVLSDGTILPPSRTEISKFFDKTKEMFNNNWKVTENGLEPKNEGIHAFRELLSDMTMEFYIKPIRSAPEHKENMANFKVFIDKAFAGEYEDSSYYNKKMKEAKDNNDEKSFLRACRDAIAEVSDHYIKSTFKEILGKRNENINSNRYARQIMSSGKKAIN